MNSDAVIGLLAIVGGALWLWHLVVGLRTGEMESPGVMFVRGSRTRSPIRFWLLGAFNLIWLIAAVVMIAHLSAF